MEWNELYMRIGGTRRDTAQGIVWEPLPPLVLSAWNFSDDKDRSKRFYDHIEWASTRGTLEIADAFVRSLAEEAWHHRFPTKPHY